MKGFVEEYGTFIVAVILGLSLVSFVITSVSSPNGAIHRFAVVNMESMGVKSETIINEWEIGGITATLKDNGVLYFTGSGELPEYSSVDETPWAAEAGNITRVELDEGVTSYTKIPIE